eukprot:TRINITY_DN26040_c0_g1_i1.p1 TRINITY_DN26040_c0_g1~~TRINITY_DN26040_c0_g1_i1.p1  ORF type:complete len:661 (+),score=73.21 TRINITY_DN26040_c0_g1_i1:98-1984(+)
MIADNSALTTVRRHGDVDSPARPHIVFVLADDLGFHDVGFRSSGIRTSTIDRLAGEGRILENYYVQPTCAPTRATIMTGRHITSHGVVLPFDNNKSLAVSFEDNMLPEALSAAGYIAHAVGKWHLGFFRWDVTPTFRGFASFYGYYGEGEHYLSHRYRNAYDFRRDEGPFCGLNCSVVERQAGKYSTELFTERSINLIAEHDVRRPLFLYLAWQAVHAPATDYCPRGLEKLYSKTLRDKRFACALTIADRGLGQIVNALKQKDMLNNTIIVFSSDNGGATSTNGRKADDIGSSNWPLRGGKHTLFEGGVRAAGFVWTGWWPSARQNSGDPLYEHLMGSVDWFPTLLEAAGITHATLQKPLEGVSHWQALSGDSAQSVSPREDLFVAVTKDSLSSVDAAYAVRFKHWKLIRGKPCSRNNPFGWSGPHGSNLVDDSYPDYTDNTTLLFNLRLDPEERNNVVDMYPWVVNRMMKLLAPHMEREPTMTMSAMQLPAVSNMIFDGAPIDGVWEPWTVITPNHAPATLSGSRANETLVLREERSSTTLFTALVVSPSEGLSVYHKKNIDDGEVLGHFEVGSYVDVVEIADKLVNGMVRARVSGPTSGWISLGESSTRLFVKRQVLSRFGGGSSA